MSGFCFDVAVTDETYSSSDLIDEFVSRYESIHKVCLPPPRDGGKDYRTIFLEGAGYFNSDNLKLLTYPRCVSTNPQQGNMDITKLKVNNDVVNRRYPYYVTLLRLETCLTQMKVNIVGIYLIKCTI